MRVSGFVVSVIWKLSANWRRPAPRRPFTPPGRVVQPAAQGHKPTRIKKEGVPEKDPPPHN